MLQTEQGRSVEAVPLSMFQEGFSKDVVVNKAKKDYTSDDNVHKVK